MSFEEPQPIEEVNVDVKVEFEEQQLVLQDSNPFNKSDGFKKCKKCGKSFNSNRGIKTHEVHCKEGPNQNAKLEDAQEQPKSQVSKPSEEVDGFTKCEKCGRSFESKRGIKTHELHCTGLNPNTKFLLLNNCKICSASFQYPSGLEQHMNVHNGIKPYKCRVQCDTHFHNTALRISHEKKCQGKQQICRFCNAKLSNPLMLARHLSSQHKGAKYECNVCGKAYTTHRRMAAHQRIEHSGEVPKFPCELCGKTFKVTRLLRRHMENRHVQEKPFRCELCNAGLSCSISLESHMKLTHGKVTVTCQICGGEFKNSTALYIHRQTVHKDVLAESKKTQERSSSDTETEAGEADNTDYNELMDSECEMD